MMASERMHDDAQRDREVPYPYELDDVPITDELPAITVDDIARVAQRLERGRYTNSYHLGRDDFDVLMRLSPEQWQEVKSDPGSLMRILALTAHA